MFFCLSQSISRRLAPAGGRPAWVSLWLMALLLGFGPAALAEITISLDVKNGEKVSDIRKITARVTGAPIDRVEFKLDDQEPAVRTSTPYIFEWDTIQSTEGDHKLTITAFDSNGQTKRVTLALIVDNELNLGAETLAQRGQEALANKEPETAVRYARRSLKAEPQNLPASRVLATVYANKGDWRRAIDALRNARNLDTHSEAMLQLAAYRMRYALLPENSDRFFRELQEVDNLRRKAAELAVQETIRQNTPANGRPTWENHQAIGDALLNAGRFEEARAEYAKVELRDDTPLPLVNRILLASVLTNNLREANELARLYMMNKQADAATRAICGLALLRQQRFTEARAVVQPDIADTVPAALIVAAWADASLDQRKSAIGYAKDAARLVPEAGDAQYALAMTLSLARDNADVELADRSLKRALALAPFQPGPYLSYGMTLMWQRRSDRFEQALNLTDFVLKHDPNNLAAKLMQGMIYLMTKRASDATAILTDLMKTERTPSADLLLAVSVYYDVEKNAGQAEAFLDRARRADPERFGSLRVTPSPQEYLLLLKRRLLYRCEPFLTLASLYPAQKGRSVQ